MATITATHRLRQPHRVFYDPRCHFLENGPEKGTRTKLPIGTHLIPSDTQLANFPDRFESLTVPEAPATAEVEDGDDEEGGEGGSEDEEEDGGATDKVAEDDANEGEDVVDEAHEAVDEALAAVNGEWDALLSDQLQELAGGYEISEDDIEGSGSGGNVLKADWIEAVQRARGGGA